MSEGPVTGNEIVQKVQNEATIPPPVAPDALDNKQIRLQEELLRLRKAVNQNPRNIALLNQLGLTAEAAGDPDRAKWAYRRAIRLQPQTSDAYINLGRFYSRVGRQKIALATFQSGLKNAATESEQVRIYELLQELENEGELAELAEITPVPRRETLDKAFQELGLTPAEAMYLMDPVNSSGQRMLRYTLLDLAARGVLEVTDNYQVGRGEKFLDKKPEPHEQVLAKYFARFEDYIDLQRLSRTVSAELNNRYDLFKTEYVRQSLVNKDLLTVKKKRFLGLIPIREYELTSQGIRARNKAKRLLKLADSQLSSTIRSHPEQADVYISEGGPSLLLLEDYSPSNFKEWQNKLVYMGFGPTIDRIRARAPSSTGLDWLDDLLKTILSQ